MLRPPTHTLGSGHVGGEASRASPSAVGSSTVPIEETVALVVASTTAAVPPLLALSPPPLQITPGAPPALAAAEMNVVSSSAHRPAERRPRARTTSEPLRPAAGSEVSLTPRARLERRPASASIVPQALWGLFDEYRTRKRASRQQQHQEASGAQQEGGDASQLDLEAGRSASRGERTAHTSARARAVREEKRLADASLGGAGGSTRRPPLRGARSEPSREGVVRPSSCPIG